MGGLDFDPGAPKVVVLGCNAFSAAHFAGLCLDMGAEVLGINRSAEGSAAFLPCLTHPRKACYQFLQRDLNLHLPDILEAIRAFRPTHVADFAGQGMVSESWGAPDQWFQTNVLAKVRLVEGLRGLDSLQKYARVSTPEVYGHTPETVTEEAPYLPSTPYAVTHAAVDMHLRACHQRYGFPVVLTRSSNFYGPGQQLYRLIPRALLSGLTGARLPLHGGGHAIRNFLYIGDFCDALWRVMTQAPAGGIYHVAGEDALSIREVVGRIAARLDLPFEVLVEVTEDRPSKDLAYRLDAQKIRRELGWCPRVRLEEGLALTHAWVAANLAELRGLPWEYVHKV